MCIEMKVFIFQSDCRLYVDLDSLMWLKHEGGSKSERDRKRECDGTSTIK